MKKQISLFITICVIALTSCGTSPSVPVATTTTEPPTVTVTFTPTLTSTPEPTFTPTVTPTPRLPVALGTQVPLSGTVISSDNIDQVVELARWGKGVITDATYSPDSKTIAVATTIGVSLYDASTLNENLYFDANASVTSLRFAPDGGTIATGLNDNTLKLWNVADGTLLKSLEGHVDESNSQKANKPQVSTVSFSPGGRFVAAGSTDGTVNMWQVSDGSLLNTFKGSTVQITNVFFSTDGQAFFFASQDGKVRMVNTSDGKPIRTFTTLSVLDAALSSNGKTLAVHEAHYDNGLFSDVSNIVLWDVESGKQIQTIAGRPAYSSGNDITSIDFSPDGQSIAAAWQDHTVKVWNVSTGVLQNTFEDLKPTGLYFLEDFVLSFSPDGQSLLSAGADTIGVWDLKSGKLMNSVKAKTEEYDGMALSPDGSTVAATEGPNVKLIHLSDGSLVPTQDQIQSNGGLTISPDGSTLLVAMFDNTARLWPLSDQGIKKSFETQKKEYIRAVAFSPDGHTVALESYTGNVELRQLSDGAVIWSMKIGTGGGLGSLTFSPDGKYMAAALDDQTQVFDAGSGKGIKLFKAGLGDAFSQDGTLLAAGNKDKKLQLWKIPTGEVYATINELPDVPLSTTFSPDGKLLVVGTWDGTISVFLTADGSPLKNWKGHGRGVTGLFFTTNGKSVISSSWDGTIRVWGLKP